MKLLIGIVILYIVAVIMYYIFFIKKERFGDTSSVKKTPDILDLKQQFDDMIVYDNDADGRLGLDKCIEKCNGYCVEYGLTGSAYCFPAVEHSVKDFNGMIVQNDTKLSFPNVN